MIYCIVIIVSFPKSLSRFLFIIITLKFFKNMICLYYLIKSLISADEADDVVVPSSPKTPVYKESVEVTRLKALMGGIPPPPEMTNPAIDMSTMLSSWYTNKHLWWDGDFFFFFFCFFLVK